MPSEPYLQSKRPLGGFVKRRIEVNEEGLVQQDAFVGNAPAADLPTMRRSRNGIHTNPESLHSLIRMCKHYDVITYNCDFSLCVPRPKRVIIGLPTNRNAETYRIPRGVSARFLRFLHTKLYLFFRTDSSELPHLAVVGSINFTHTSMVECAIEVNDPNQLEVLQTMFNLLWKQAYIFKP